MELSADSGKTQGSATIAVPNSIDASSLVWLALRIFRDSIPDKEYPTGTILQLIPTEAMVKHDRAAFPNTNGWEFFALQVSSEGTTIQDRGDKVLNTSVKKPCLDCHSPAAKFDFVCEKGHGCAPIPVTDQQIAAIQAADPRCKK
jgi:hypothetical protein